MSLDMQIDSLTSIDGIKFGNSSIEQGYDQRALGLASAGVGIASDTANQSIPNKQGGRGLE